MNELVRVGKTHCQGHQDPDKSVSIFDRETEANSKMASIKSGYIPRTRTVCRRDDNVYYYIGERLKLEGKGKREGWVFMENTVRRHRRVG